MVSSQAQVTLTVQVPGTSNAKVAHITVNPAPVIASVIPEGVMGAPYSGSLTGSLGTPSLKAISIAAGSLPGGLAFNPATGTISGTPTAVGTFVFSAQLTDSSYIPYTVTVPETLTISASSTGPSLSLSGAPPNGTVGVALRYCPDSGRRSGTLYLHYDCRRSACRVEPGGIDRNYFRYSDCAGDCYSHRTGTGLHWRQGNDDCSAYD